MSDEGAIDNADPVPAASNSMVVGHDGSACADYALTTALELADQLQAPVVVARAWSIATAPKPSNWEFGRICSFDEYSVAVHDQLVRDARTAVEKYPAVSIAYRVLHSGPAESLIEVSRDARMLVVGSRGRGGLAGMLLGSVSDKCVRHAACSVLVVRPRT